MTHSQYMRIESVAGGTDCTERAFIRACRTLIKHEAKGRACRVQRQQWIRGGLAVLWQIRYGDREVTEPTDERDQQIDMNFMWYEDWVTEIVAAIRRGSVADAQALVSRSRTTVRDGYARDQSCLVWRGSLPVMRTFQPTSWAYSSSLGRLQPHLLA